jgi:hypothetical protein
MVFLTNALGEDTGHKEINADVYKWYEENAVDNGWLHYLAELNGEVGILAIQEFSSPDGDDWDEQKRYVSEAWSKSTNQEILEHLEDVAQKIENKTDFTVMVGNGTGFMAMHEIGIWYPNSTNKEAIEKSFEKIKDIQLYY